MNLTFIVLDKNQNRWRQGFVYNGGENYKKKINLLKTTAF